MTSKVHDRRILKWIAADAMASGNAEQASLSTVRWNAAGRCHSPVYRELVGRSPVSVASNTPRTDGRLTVEIEAPCRKCPACLKARAGRWRRRAIAEITSAQRSWFGTLTLAPEWRFNALSRARLRAAKQGEDFETYSETDRFRKVCDQIGLELTRWLKRVRKNSGAKLRYCAVYEKHSDGFPHLHLLIHQRTDAPVTYRHLGDAWAWGFSNFKLVNDDRAASYVTKYLSKSMLARVRASIEYGLAPTSVGDSEA